MKKEKNTPDAFQKAKREQAKRKKENEILANVLSKAGLQIEPLFPEADPTPFPPPKKRVAKK